MVEQGQRLSRLVENLLDVSRLETGNAEPHREPVDLPGLLEAARHSIGARGEARAAGARPRAAGAQRRPDPARARLRQPARERRRPRRRPAGPGPLAPGRAAPRGPGGRPRPGHPRGRARADLRALLPRRAPRPATAPGSAWRSPSGFVEANGGEIEVESLPGQGSSFVVSFAAPGEAARDERRAAHPRLRRRAADPAGAEGDPARRRLRGGDRRARERRRSTAPRSNRPRRRSST